MEKVQIQIKQKGDKNKFVSRSLTIEDMGSVMEIHQRISSLFELLEKHRTEGEVTITHKII